MKGAFQVSREIFDNEIWADAFKFRIFFYLLGNAVFSQEGIKQAGIHIERGQYLRSLRNLQDDLSYKEGRGNAVKKIPLETLRRKIKSLENEGRIKTKSTEYGTLFTVVNYAKYQGFDHYSKQSMGQQWDSNETAMSQQWDNNKNVKECSKNEKNDKEDYTSKIKDLLPVFQSISNFNQLNKDYWDCIRETRKTGKIAKSVIYNNMELWKKYDPIVIEYALKTHIEQHKGKQEKYTIGIMRGTKPEEAKERLHKGIKNNVVHFNKGGVKYGDGTESNGEGANNGGHVQFWT